MVKVELEQEVGTSHHPARVIIYDGNQLVEEVTAKVELKKGADGGWYHCVTLKKNRGGDNA